MLFRLVTSLEADTAAEDIVRNADERSIPNELITAGNGGRISAEHLERAQRRGAKDKTVHLALYDKPTDFPKRALFMERLGLADRQHSRDPSPCYGVLFLDINRFKLITTA